MAVASPVELSTACAAMEVAPPRPSHLGEPASTLSAAPTASGIELGCESNGERPGFPTGRVLRPAWEGRGE